ncbi:MAG TPA: M20 aminoacylase family protein [Azospirillaceae bacterium]|nr:M20 aminoacylase family protein [Azospirillaceae bacterium]
MPVIPRIAAFHADMAQWRRDIHAHPELAFEEFRTSDLVAAKLAEFGVEVYRGLAETGVVGVLTGRGMSTRAIGLRADMDALPMQEANGFAHASRHPGRMHACGHDGHTVMLLGAARYLAETRDFDGTVHLIFQPAEEGKGGGRRMVEEGLFEKFPCDRVFGMHNWPDLPAGAIGVLSGAVMAAADQFDIEIAGHGAHGAMPHHGTDPVVVACHVVTALQTLVSRNTDPLDSAVVSVTKIHGGTAHNVIPAEVTISGTMRSFRPETRRRLEEGLGRVAGNVAAAFGATARLFFRPGYPATVNTGPEVDLSVRAASRVVDEANIVRDTPPSMAAEDFAYMLRERPGTYVWLGQGAADGCPLHSPHYDFNNDVLPIGASYWASLVETALPRAGGAN